MPRLCSLGGEYAAARSLSSRNCNINYNIQVVVAPTTIHVDLVKRNIRNDISGMLFD